jgi:hypothetical protein
MALLHEPSPFIESRIDSWLMLEAFTDLAMSQVPLSFRKLCEELECAFPPEIDSNHPLAGAVMMWVADGLPFWTFMRFMDNFVIDGYKTFYRFGLACVQRWAVLHNIKEERESPDPGSESSSRSGSRPGSPGRSPFKLSAPKAVSAKLLSPMKPSSETKFLQPPAMPGSPSMSTAGSAFSRVSE